MAELLKSPWKAGLLMAVIAGLLGLAVFQKELNTNGDNGAYIAYAQSLAKGDGLRLASHPEHPKSDQYPLLYPLFLAFWIKLFGYRLMVLKAAMLGVFCLAMVLFLLAARRSFAGAPLLGLCLLTVTNYWLLDNASITMSESFFMLFLLAGYLFYQQYEGKESRPALFAAAFFIVLSPFVRTIGIAAVFALFSVFALKRKWTWLAACAIACGIAYVVNHSFMAPGGYLSTLFLVDPYNPDMGTLGLTGMAGRITDNARFYMENTVQMTLFSFFGDKARFDRTSVLIFTGLVVVLFFALPPREILRRPGALFLRVLVLFHFGILLAWPMVWSGPRFVVPVIPFLLLILFENGHYWVTRFVKPELVPRLEKAVLGVCVLWSALNFSAIYQKTHTPLTPDWTDFYKLAGWSQSGLPDSAVVCARSPYLFYLKSSKVCVQIPVNADRKKALQYLFDNKVDYVVIDHFQWTGSTQVYVAPLLDIFPERFEPVKAMGTAAVWHLKR
jgi:hypothetical protein